MELKDVYQKRNIKFTDRFGEVDRFVDKYYNYLINDWIVRKRISSIISMLEALEDNIFKMIGSLGIEKLNVEKNIKKHEKMKKKLISEKLK